MTTLVVGAGAEDVEAPLGAAVVAGHLHPAGFIGLDLVAARSSSSDGQLLPVLSWFQREERPSRVVLVDGCGTDDEVAAVHAVFGEAVQVVADEAAVLDRLRELIATAQRPQVRDRSPRVTLAMAVYNQEPYLDDVLRSALGQDYDDYEVLVVDDGSTDATPRILDRYAGDPRLRVLSQSNIGQTGRMDLINNRMARHSRGDLLAVVGGDDLCRPGRLRAQVAAFDEDAHLDVCHGAMAYIGADGQSLGRDVGLPRSYDGWSHLRNSVPENLVAHPTVMIRRSAHERLALYAEGVVSDYELWLKTAGRLRYRYLPQRLTDYRVHARSLSTSQEGFRRCALESARVVEQVLHRRGLADLFPELALLDAAPTTWYAAGLHLGNRFVTSQPSVALHLYGLALEHHEGPEVHQNAALALLALQELPRAVERAARAAALDPGLGGLLGMLTGGPPVPLRLLGLDGQLGAALAAARREGSTWTWDGGSTAVRSVSAAVDPRRPDLTAAAVAAWVGGTRSGDPLRWVVPTLGSTQDQVLGLLLASGASTSLVDAAEVVIEDVDDAGLLPPDARAALLLSGQDALAGFLADLPALERTPS